MQEIKITKRLEELFGLDQDSESEPILTEPPIERGLISKETLATIEKVENALHEVRGLESSDGEMDELAELAKSAFNDLMDLGTQTDPRFSAEIFTVGSTMLGHAIAAKTAKINKKLKIIDLQLKKAELDRKISLAAKDKVEETPLGAGQIVDRNALIKMVAENLAQSKNSIKDK